MPENEPMPERVRVVAHCYGGLECGDAGTVVEALDGEAIVRFDRDASERLIIRANLEAIL